MAAQRFSAFSERSGVPPDENELSALLAESAPGARIDLSAANPTRVGLPDPGFASLLARGEGSYAPDPRGLVSAREAVTRLYTARGARVDADDVLLTASTSEAYSYLLTVLCDPGDAILAPEPSYPLFEHLSRLAGVRIAPYRLVYDGAWHVDVDSVARAVTERTRAIFCVSPNNPTGSFLSTFELERLWSLGLPLVVDEVFRPYAWSSFTGPLPEPLAEPPVLTCVLDGLSKRIGAPQLKLGWIALGGPGRAECARRLEYVADTFLSVSGPVQRALPALLAAGESVQSALRARIEANLASVRRVCRDAPLDMLRAEGGWYATLRFPNVRDEAEWLRLLVTREGISAHPGWLFDHAEGPLFVLSLIHEPETFAEALERVARLVQSEC